MYPPTHTHERTCAREQARTHRGKRLRTWMTKLDLLRLGTWRIETGGSWGEFWMCLSVSFTEIRGQGVPDRRGRLGKSTFAVLLEPVAWDRESSCIACRAQSATDSIQTEKVREIWRKESVEAFVAEKRQLVLNSLRNRQPVEFFQSRSNMIAFPHA